jgi:3-methyladenine DNA glycosylase AlkD
MPRRPHPLVVAVRGGLAALADPARAAGAQAYMKSEMPFRGVPAAEQKRLWRQAFAAHLPATGAEWQQVILDLWRPAAYREERYAAIGLASDRRYLSYRTLAAIPMLEEMIVTGAWWDFVDTLASHPLGDVLIADPARVSRLMRRWARDPNLWKRRAAILCQLRRRQQTDLTLLYDCIEPNLADPEFFIRKAIGWALRSYAWTDAPEIRRYVAANRGRLSPLSAREAMKNIAGSGADSAARGRSRAG